MIKKNIIFNLIKHKLQGASKKLSELEKKLL